jgi:hypothetical protein
MTNLEILIKKIELIEFKYQKLKEIENNFNRFNIFSILRDKNDEVNLHSKFIYELLNPLGSHGMRDSFLNLFLEIVGLEKYRFEDFRVYREKYNIDILLLSKEKAIIIENKIQTYEHSNQLKRYFETIKNKGYKDIEIIYLTLFGNEPESLKSRVINISYRYEIRAWIDKSISLVAKYPNIRETLIQYLELIEKLTHKRDNRGFIMETKELLLKDNNLKTILSIQPAVIEAKIEIQLRFWRELLEYLKNRGYEFNFYNINGDISLESSVRRYYIKKKNNRDYGFEFHISKNLYFFIEIRKNIYYGFYFNGDIDRDLVNILDKIDIDWEEPYWKYPDSRLNFEEFNDNVLKLINKDNLKETILDIGDEIVYLLESLNKEKK